MHCFEILRVYAYSVYINLISIVFHLVHVHVYCIFFKAVLYSVLSISEGSVYSPDNSKFTKAVVVPRGVVRTHPRE